MLLKFHELEISFTLFAALLDFKLGILEVNFLNEVLVLFRLLRAIVSSVLVLLRDFGALLAPVNSHSFLSLSRLKQFAVLFWSMRRLCS